MHTPGGMQLFSFLAFHLLPAAARSPARILRTDGSAAAPSLLSTIYKTMKTGLIGIGSMGMAMALNLHRKGLPVCVHDIRAEAMQAASAAGMTVCRSPAELAQQTDLIIVVVVNAGQIDQVLFGEAGVCQMARPGKTVMLCSTIAPEDTLSIADRLTSLGMNIIDGPISGGPIRAEAGTMSIMLAGADNVIASHQSVLDALSDKIFRLGSRIGDGARYKLVNNLLAGINLVAAAEAIALGTKLGLDQQKLLALMSASSGQSMMLEDRMTRALANDYAPRAHAHILTKDVALGVAMAGKAGQPTPLAAWALEIFKATLASGYDSLDDAAVLKILLEEHEEDATSSSRTR
jgi:putative dehydrogenase